MSHPMPRDLLPENAKPKTAVPFREECTSKRCVPVYDDNPDGFVVCLVCGTLLLYCDVGGSG